MATIRENKKQQQQKNAACQLQPTATSGLISVKEFIQIAVVLRSPRSLMNSSWGEGHVPPKENAKEGRKRERERSPCGFVVPLPFKQSIRDLRAHTHTHTHTHTLAALLLFLCKHALGTPLMRLQEVRICALLPPSQSAGKGAGLPSSISFVKESQNDLKLYKLESAHHPT